MSLQFIGSHPVKSNVMSFEFQPSQGMRWQPGQYLHYALPHSDTDERGTERWFTNSAAPSEAKVVITTRLDDEHGSSFKKALQALSPGDTIEADGPEGDFTIDDESRNYIFLAGGIGITPFRSILAEAHAQGKRLKVKLLYANRNDEIPFQDDLESYAADNPELSVEYIIHPEILDAKRIKQVADQLASPLMYLSGPEPMVKGLASNLQELGVDKNSIKLDDFPGYEGI